MFESMYTKEINDVRVLLNASNMLQNFRYKIMKDKNMRDFFDKLMANAVQYDSMERIQRYYFNDDLKVAYKVLNLFMKGLQRELKERRGEEFMKCCNVFPDEGGKECMYIVSHLPLINLLEEKRLYYEYVSKYNRKPEGEVSRWDMKEHQKDVLFEDKSLFHRTFPKDEDLVDYDLRDDHIDFVRSKYEDKGRLGDINAEIEVLVSVFDGLEKEEELKKLKWDLGVMYWDGVIEKQRKKSEEFGKIFENMVKALSEKKD